MSLAASFTGLKFDYVDSVTEVAEKALPLGGKDVGLAKGALGNWRTHLNVMRT